jgi:hypothetical protein
MLPRSAQEAVVAGSGVGGAGGADGTGVGPAGELGPRRAQRRARRDAAAAAAPASRSGTDGTDGRDATPRQGLGAHGAGAATAPARPIPLQAYLDAYRDHLTRELLLEPIVADRPVAGFAWTPEPTGDGGVAVGGTVPAAIADQVVLRMAADAVAQLGRRSPESAGVPLGDPEPDGDLLVQRWAVGAARAYVLSVAARSGDRRRPTQVLIHLAAIEPDPEPVWSPGTADVAVPAQLEAPYEVPRTGQAVDDARRLLILPMWWHSADARCDGNDVILYEMPFRGRRLRIRANDYPAEPMYTLLVGDPGAEIAAVDLEGWPAPWTRPRAY